MVNYSLPECVQNCKSLGLSIAFFYSFENMYILPPRVGIVNFTDESTFDLMETVIIILLISNQLQFMGYLGEAKKSSDSKWN